MSIVLDQALKEQRPLSDVGLSLEFSSTNRIITSVTSDGLPIEAFVKFADEPKHLLCLLPSAQSQTKAPLVPFFPRWSWASGFPDWDVISLSDPMLNAAPDLHASWFVSNTADITEELAGFVEEFRRAREIPSSAVTLYGSSMGGFGALMIASCLRGARAVAEVPQLDLLRYPDKRSLAEVQRLALDGASLEQIEQSAPEKLNVTARFQHSDYIPPLTIFTNRADSAHQEALDLLAHINLMAPSVSKVGPSSVVQLPQPQGHAVQPSLVMIDTLKALAKLPCELADGRQRQIVEAPNLPVPVWDAAPLSDCEWLPLKEKVTWIESRGNGRANLELEVMNPGPRSEKGLVISVVVAAADEATMNNAGFRFTSYRDIGYFKYLPVDSGTSQLSEFVDLGSDTEILGFGLAAWDLKALLLSSLKITSRA